MLAYIARFLPFTAIRYTLILNKNMTFHIITLFPEVFEAYVNSSMLWRAQKEKKVKFKFYNPRDYTKDKHRK
ncbi:MAG: hypothetical protein Q8P52_00880, partial [bacterium]|nr:hypothetical protein [bacterium]